MAAVLTVERLEQLRCTVDDGGLVAEVGHTVDQPCTRTMRMRSRSATVAIALRQLTALILADS